MKKLKEKGEDKEIPAKAELKGKVGEDKEKVKAKEGAKHPGKEGDAHLEKFVNIPGKTSIYLSLMTNV